MRREWSGWIRNRQWAEMEKLAKAEPSQPLTDTIAELERGFPDKADRKALKRILYLLGERGFTPTPLDELTSVPDVPVTNLIRRALLATADTDGNTNLHIALESNHKVRYLNVTIHAIQGVRAASEQSSLTAEFEKHWLSIQKEARTTRAVGEVDFDYAAFRIRQAVRNTKKRLPTSIASWTEILTSDTSVVHPTTGWTASETDDETLFDLTQTLDHVWGWRFEMGLMYSGLEWLYSEQLEGKNDTPAEKEERYRQAMKKLAADVVTDADLADYALRCRDIALVTRESQPKNSDRALAAALDIETRGTASPFLRAIIEKTVVSLVVHLKSLGDQEAAVGK